jgi:hypothetical protein
MKSTFAFVAFLLVLCGAALNSEAQDNQNVPPRVEIGGLMSAATQSDVGNYFHAGAGGRVAVNITKFFAGEAEASRQPTDNNLAAEYHAFLAAKATYRAEQQRRLKFGGINLFGVLGPAFVNRFVGVAAGCNTYKCTTLQRQTAGMLEWGGGFEVVPARRVTIRFDATHANFSEPIPYDSGTIDKRRTYLKVAVMLRVP